MPNQFAKMVIQTFNLVCSMFILLVLVHIMWVGILYYFVKVVASRKVNTWIVDRWCMELSLYFMLCDFTVSYARAVAVESCRGKKGATVPFGENRRERKRKNEPITFFRSDHVAFTICMSCGLVLLLKYSKKIIYRNVYWILIYVMLSLEWKMFVSGIPDREKVALRLTIGPDGTTRCGSEVDITYIIPT